MNRAVDPLDWPGIQVREWLLLLLRFAITLEPKDQAAALSLAYDIDTLGQGLSSSVPTFFRSTNEEVCRAIAGPDDPKREAVLKTHLGRINDVRLRRAFRAAVNLDQRRLSASSDAKRRNLWTGLGR